MSRGSRRQTGHRATSRWWRSRGVVFALLTAVLITAAAVYSLSVSRRPTATTVPGGAPSAGATIPLPTGPRIVVRDTSFGADYGKVAVVPLSAPDGPRALLDLRCERVDASARAGLCLTVERGVITRNRARVLDGALRERRELALTGLPSRTRVTADGRLGATTVFETGHSYAGSDFSTATVLHDLDSGRSLGNLEDWTYLRDGRRFRSADLNVWGVTFADAVPLLGRWAGTAADDAAARTGGSRRFFATVSAAGRRDLVVGDVDRRELRGLRPGVECPSLSPDGRRIAYKHRLGGPDDREWRLHVLDLDTGADRALGETRSVDDQVEWLDETSVLYAMPQEGLASAESDVWVAPVDGGAPRLLVPRAASPSAIR